MTSIRSLARSLSLLVCCSGSTAVAQEGATGEVRAQGTTWVRSAGAQVHVSTFDEATGFAQTALPDVEFLGLDLIGAPARDRLRIDRPRSRVLAGISSIALPGGGALYRVGLGEQRTALMLVHRDRSPRVLIELDDVGVVPGIAPEVVVRLDGRAALLVTAAGGLVLQELVPPFATEELESGLPVGFEPDTLRLGQGGAWFVASGALYRRCFEPAEPAVEVGLGSGYPVHSQLVLADAADRIVALLEKPDGKRRPLAVDIDGTVVFLASYEHFSRPALDHPLGPWLAISPDGEFVALRDEKDDEHEVFVCRVEQGAALAHLTTTPDFPAYIDSAGVLAFAGPKTLCFFGGDRKLGGFTADASIGAADMYSVELTDLASFDIINVTRTNGDPVPPFDDLAELAFDGTWVDALGERILLLGSTEDGARSVSSFRIDGGDDLGAPNHDELLTGLAEDPTLLPGLGGVVAVGDLLEDWPPYAQDESKTECEGLALTGETVRVLVTNKQDPEDSGAHVWFDGLRRVGETFVADAASAGKTRLDNETHLHFLDSVTDEALQHVELETSCSQALHLGDRFGAAQLVAAVGEKEGDACANGSKPTVLYLCYVGGACGDSKHEQGDKAKCEGQPTGVDHVWVRASDKKDVDDEGARVWYEGWVDLGQTLAVEAAAADEQKLESDTHLHLLDGPGGDELQYLKVHTSCSKPLILADRHGALELVGWQVQDPPAPEDACAEGRPRQLEFQLLAAGCERLSLGVIASVLPPVGQAAPTAQVIGAPAGFLGGIGDLRSSTFGLLVRGAQAESRVWWVRDGDLVPQPVPLAGAVAPVSFAFSGGLVVGRSLSQGTHGLLILHPGGGGTVVDVASQPLAPLAD